MKPRWQHGGNVYEIQRQLGIDSHQILDFSANINPLGFPAGLAEAIVAGVSDLVHYPDPDYTDLAEAIGAAKGVAPATVYPGNGAIELLYGVMEYLKPRRAHVMAPGFIEYERSLRRYGAEIRWLQLREEDDFRLTAQTVAPALGHPGEPLVLCSPNNPTGALIEPALLTEILHRAAQAGQPVILDEAFMDFVSPEKAQECLPLTEAYPNLFVLRSMTKCYAIPGLRLGYLVTGSPAFAAWMQEYRIPWMVNHLAVRAGLAALADGDHLVRTRAYVGRQRELLRAALESLPGITVYPAEANFLCLKLENPQLDLKARLLGSGILLRSCANYIGLDSHYYRVAIRTDNENRRLIRALEAVLGS